MLRELVLTTVACAGLACAAPAEAQTLDRRLENGLSRTPALGWNSWNIGGCAYANAASALSTGRAFVNLGLKDLGYTYVNIDDCWSTKSRDSAGRLVPDPQKWPNGMKAVADELHGMGLKFGLYGCAGKLTCAGYPGSRGHEGRDAETLASWGVDYWKYDACYTPCGSESNTPQSCWSPAVNTSQFYAPMRDALSRVSRPILFSMCQWGRDSVWTWGTNYGNSWRMSGDIWDGWKSVASIAASASRMAPYAGPGGFNDLDMMEIGNGGLSEAEERAHFGIWAIAKSPIILGTDMTKIKSSSLNIIKNKGILAIHQDPLGKAAGYFRPSGAPAPVSGELYPYWAGPLSDGVVIGLVASQGAATLRANFADVPGLGPGTYSWTEMYSGKTGTGTSVSANLGTHDMAVFKVTKSGGSGTTTTTTGPPPPTSTTTTAASTTTASGGGGSQTHWGQCGGIGWTGPTSCETPYKCTYSNPYYSQCL